jgi:hypothetical protein
MDGSESAQFEYRLYEGVLFGNPLFKQLYGAIVNPLLNGLTIKSGSPLRDQLSSFFQNNTFIPTIPFNITPILNSLVSLIPAGLSLPGIGRAFRVAPIVLPVVLIRQNIHFAPAAASAS